MDLVSDGLASPPTLLPWDGLAIGCVTPGLVWGMVPDGVATTPRTWSKMDLRNRFEPGVLEGEDTRVHSEAWQGVQTPFNIYVDSN